MTFLATSWHCKNLQQGLYAYKWHCQNLQQGSYAPLLKLLDRLTCPSLKPGFTKKIPFLKKILFTLTISFYFYLQKHHKTNV